MTRHIHKVRIVGFGRWFLCLGTFAAVSSWLLVRRRYMCIVGLRILMPIIIIFRGVYRRSILRAQCSRAVKDAEARVIGISGSRWCWRPRVREGMWARAVTDLAHASPSYKQPADLGRRQAGGEAEQEPS